MATEADLLVGARWQCAATPPGEAADPAALTRLPLRWLAADVPGTAAGALRRSSAPERSSAELDEEDWWFRCRFAGPDGPGGAGMGGWLMELAGLATVSDVWLNGEHLAHVESMFSPCRVRV
ncbi:MAG: glycosyl hydrolase 2 galactose-binding domain-containing protein, partial [Acidimicrobiales bacterium]